MNKFLTGMKSDTWEIPNTKRLEELRVGSHNVNSLLRMLGALKLVEGDEKPWQTLVRYMEATGLDVLFLQEIKGTKDDWSPGGKLPYTVEQVMKHEKYFMKITKGHEGGQSGVGVLVNTETISFTAKYGGLTTRLKKLNVAFEGRCIAIETNNVGSAPVVLMGIYNFTVKHGGNAKEFLEALLNECVRIRAEGKFPVLVGDFNMDQNKILKLQAKMSVDPGMRDANSRFASETPRRSNFSNYRDTYGNEDSMAKERADGKTLSVLNRESIDGLATSLVDFVLVHSDIEVLEPRGRMVGCGEDEGCDLHCKKRECAERAILATIGMAGHLLPPISPFMMYHAECVSDHLLVHATILPPVTANAAPAPAPGKRAAAEGQSATGKKAKA